MIRVQQLLFPAILLGCLMVILLTSMLANPEEVIAAAGQALHTIRGPDSTAENMLQSELAPSSSAKANEKPKKASKSKLDGNQDGGNGCSLGIRFPDSVRQWCGLIEKYAQEQNLDANLIAAVIYQESGGNPQSYSGSGAVGLMQVMPRDGLAAGFMCGGQPCFSSRPSMNELYDPEFNISYGTRMLSYLNNRYGNLRDALMAYGPANVGYYYADIVLDLYENYK
jgi:hypothetical protein